MTIQKVDTKWELEIYRFLATNLADRRAHRGEAPMRPFNLSLTLDDPDALGVEKWQLNGCLIWRLPLGFSIGDDIVSREFPLTFESETPLSVFRRLPGGPVDDTSGLPKITQWDSTNPLPGDTTLW